MNSVIVKAEKIKLLILDVDGVLTTGMLYYNSQGEAFKPFHVHDGLGIRMLQRAGISVAVISAKGSEPLIARLKDLRIEHLYLNQENKRIPYEELKSKLNLQDEQIAYVGDDIIDLPILTKVGLPITVANGVEEVKQKATLITKQKGGKGAVREVCELLLKAQDKYEDVVKSYH